MRDQILSIIKQHKKQKIRLIDIDDGLKTKGIDVFSNHSVEIEFRQLINCLTEEGVLTIMKSSRPLQSYGGLFDKYTISNSFFEPENVLSNNQLYVEMTTKLSSKIDISYYLKNHDRYVMHREYILKISAFLSGNDEETITANERSYELFGDEKALTAPEDAVIDGNQILKNLRLTYDDIKAERVFEPFVYLKSEKFDELQGRFDRTVLIIENKDTYWTFKNALILGNLDFVDLVIYGEGKAIWSKFQFIEEVGGSTSDNYYYFGDLDSEGLNIYNQLYESYSEYNIHPAVSFYEYLLKKEGFENSKALRTSQKIMSLSPFIDFFMPNDKDLIERLIAENRYIPQEAVNKKDLRKLKDGGLY